MRNDSTKYGCASEWEIERERARERETVSRAERLMEGLDSYGKMRVDLKSNFLIGRYNYLFVLTEWAVVEREPHDAHVVRVEHAVAEAHALPVCGKVGCAHADLGAGNIERERVCVCV